MITVGDKSPKIFVGDKQVKEVWIGLFKVYPNSSLSVLTVPENFAAAGGSQTMVVNASEDLAWSITSITDGFTASPMSGVGPTNVTITASNNMTTSRRRGNAVITAAEDDLTATAPFIQLEGSQIYTEWTNVGLVLATSSFPASGGTSSLFMNISRSWTWNGVSGTGATENATASVVGGTTTDGDFIVSGNMLRAQSLGNRFKNATTATITAVSDHDGVNRMSITASQAANYVVSGRALKDRSIWWGEFPASGQVRGVVHDSYPDTAALNTLWAFTMASGANISYGEAANGGGVATVSLTYSWAGSVNGFDLDANNGNVSAIGKGTTISGVTYGNQVTMTQVSVFNNTLIQAGGATPGFVTYGYGTPQQAANGSWISSCRLGEYYPDSSWLPSSLWGSIPANGGLVGVQGWFTTSYSSGAAVETHYGLVNQASGLAKNESWSSFYGTAGIHVPNRGTSVGVAQYGEMWWNYGGVSSNHIGYGQVANYVAYSGQSIGGNNNILPASGGTDTMYFVVRRDWTSGASDLYYPTSAEWSLTGGAAGFSVNNSNKTVVAENRWQTSGGARSVWVVGTYAGVQAGITVSQNHNNPTYTYSCSGYTKNERWQWPSGAPDTTASTPNSPDCGYQFTLAAQLASSWSEVRPIVGQDYVDIFLEVGRQFNQTEQTCTGTWDQNRDRVSWGVSSRQYAWGGATGNSGGNFVWSAGAWVEITNRSGGLAYFYWNTTVSAHQVIEIAGRY